MSRDHAEQERRRGKSSPRQRPPPSPASFVVLTVSAVLLATAAAAALLGDGLSDGTPHGALLGTLHDLAEAQEEHYRATGRFASWAGALDVTLDPDVDVRVVHASQSGWEAVATAPDVGLTCSRSGSVSGTGSPLSDRPVCFTRGE